MGLFAFRGNYVKDFQESLAEPKHETRKPSFGEEPQLETPQSDQPKPGNQLPKPRKRKASQVELKTEITPAEITPAKEVSNDADV